MTSPTFSIIIPVYNVAPYLRECLDSVLAQTFKDWEAICVDDGSTDGSSTILDEYAVNDRRFRVIHQSNAGVSAARNKGLDEAVGEWIWFVDSDDILMPIALSTFYSIDKKADVTFFSMEIMYNDGFRGIYFLKPIFYRELDESSSFDLLTLMRHNSFHRDLFGFTVNKFIRHKIISDNNIRFDESLNYFEDEIFALNLFRYVKSFACLDVVFYRYRIQNNSLTRSGRKDYFSIGVAFVREVTRAVFLGVRRLAFIRAVDFLRQAMHSGNRIHSAHQLLKLYRAHGRLDNNNGRFEKMAVILSRLPIAVGSVVLMMVESMRRH